MGEVKFSDEETLRQSGFSGFLTVEDLTASRCAEAPAEAGVYVVIREATTAPVFLNESVGGHFKGRDPTVDAEVLEANWVSDAVVLYIGKAAERANRSERRRGIRGRLDEYMQFGAGKPAAHQGGKLIWQLADAKKLLVGWRTESEPEVTESELLAAFVEKYGRLPFANRRR